MRWNCHDFLHILATPLAQSILSNSEVEAYVKLWRDINKAALFHANGIDENTNPEEALQKLQLVAAFSAKNLKRIQELLYIHQVSAGVRLDYLLPLYDVSNGGGEDMFVTSTKLMLRGQRNKNLTITPNQMQHLIGPAAGSPYTSDELSDLENYVNNSFAVRDLLQNAPNQTCIQPNIAAVDYILEHADNYLDSNNNPTPVFIPGAISITGKSVPDMLEIVIEQFKGDVNAVGFFGVPGIVWSIILGDLPSVKKFHELGASFTIRDEMGNPHVLAWAGSTLQACADNQAYQQRMQNVIAYLEQYINDADLQTKNYFDSTPTDYLLQHLTV